MAHRTRIMWIEHKGGHGIVGPARIGRVTFHWISGCRRDGMDALYSTDVEVDEDAAGEYWREIRQPSENVDVRAFRAPGRC